MNKFTNVSCTYTGGGIYEFHALYNGEVWILSDLDTYGLYDINPEAIEEQYDCNYDSHWMNYPHPLPTWAEILSAIICNYGHKGCTNLDPHEVERILRRYHPDLTLRIAD